MTCRAPTSQTTCSGSSPTGAQLSYDTEGRLAAWQNTPTSPTTTASYLYDGAGQRVQQAVTVNGSITTTTTTYIAGGLEESVSSGAGTTLTKYFTAGGSLPTLERVGTSGPVSVLASDGQGTVAESFDSSGTVTSAQLYTPYGVSRYSSGSSPTSHGYTGQVADSSTGLDYYHARYYDPVAGNPTTATDPSGYVQKCDDGDCGTPPKPCPSPCSARHAHKFVIPDQTHSRSHRLWRDSGWMAVNTVVSNTPAPPIATALRSSRACRM